METFNFTDCKCKNLISLEIPGDKSVSHRSIIFSALSDEKVIIKGFLKSEDCLHTLKVFQALGIKIEITENEIIVFGNGLSGLSAPKDILYIGNSGTSLRLLTGLLAVQPFNSEITGDESIQKRPMKRIINPLSQIGCTVTGKQIGNDVAAPLQITGISSVQSSLNYKLPIASAQVKSSLLIASLFCKEASMIEDPFHSRDHTERMLQHFNADIDISGDKIYCSGKNKLTLSESNVIQVPGDISSAAFFIILGLKLPAGSKMVIKNIGLNPSRSVLINLLKKMNATIEVSHYVDDFEPRADLIISPSETNNITVDEKDVVGLIDEFPILAILAMRSTGRFRVSNAEELTFKESNRIRSIQAMITAFGGNISISSDGFEIIGNQFRNDQIVQIETFHDHRIAMSSLIGGVIGKQTIQLSESESIQTSFPNFLTLLKSIFN